jgi:hypothetical protein
MALIDKKVFFFCVLPDTQKLVRTTPHKLLVQFYPNFTGIISNKSICAHCLSVTKLVPTTSHKLLGQFHPNFTGIYVATTPITSPFVTKLSQHEIGYHEATCDH